MTTGMHASVILPVAAMSSSRFPIQENLLHAACIIIILSTGDEHAGPKDDTNVPF